MANLKTLAFEIGTEEIPAFDLKNATEQMEGLVAQQLDDAGVVYGAIKIYSSPRRLIAIVNDVADQTEEQTIEHKGPSKKIALDDDGNFTKAAIGFAKGKGVDVEDLVFQTVGDIEYAYAIVKTEAKNTTDLLPDALLGIIEAINWPKSMKWGSERALFTRPIRWIVALLGDELIPIKYADVQSGTNTYGHRVLAPGAHAVKNADALIDVVRSTYVIPSEKERKEAIEAGVSKAEKATGFTAVLPPKTLTEVINLSEYPTVMVGEFDSSFLAVPEEIIVDAMLMHQRYFPLYKDGKLTNKFIVVSNGNPECEEIIIDGNERVVAARLYDAKFFYEEDLKRPLNEYVQELNNVVFQEKLGSMLDKTKRVEKLADALIIDAALDEAEANDIRRAAELLKADLVTNAVIEFTSVQGIMGSYYASASGEAERVSKAIAEHYRPRFAGDEPPADIVGKIVAIADKLDTICGLFAVNQAPTGSSDPFALRRNALGIIAILQSGVDISIAKAIKDSLKTYKETGLDFAIGEVYDNVIDFFATRCRVLLHDEGIAYDVIDAVLAVGVVEPITIIERAKALDKARNDAKETFDDLSTAYGRANNLRDSRLGEDVDPTLFSDVEKQLLGAIEKVSTEVNEAIEDGVYTVALDSLATLREPIDNFFDTTMIMDEDLELRENRIKLLNRFVSVFANVADFSIMAKVKKN